MTLEIAIKEWFTSGNDSLEPVTAVRTETVDETLLADGEFIK